MKTIHDHARFKALAMFGLVGLFSACAVPPGHYGQDYTPTVPQYNSYERYERLQDNRFYRVAEAPLSTFSIDVDTASYANARRFLNGGQLPPRDAVRSEEFINYFDYDYPQPETENPPFLVHSELGPSPWNTGSYLMHIGIKAYEPQREQQPARNLVFLVDVSGSMSSANKLGLWKKSMRLLVKQLDEQDTVAIVVYAGDSGVALEPTPGNQHRRILRAIERLSAGGSTHGAAGLQLAYELAVQNFNPEGTNRVLLATDGDFNVGPSSNRDLLRLIKEKKRSGVALTVLGFGMGNYNDSMLEAISNSGDGNAAYIDNLQEAQKVLVHDIHGTLQTVAADTKIQVEFNPQQVSRYRLIGYENRLLNTEDFSNDRVDAGEVGAGHTVTALYEITLNEGRRYQPDLQTQTITDELAYVKIRYKAPGHQNSQEMVHGIQRDSMHEALAQTTTNFRFAAAVAGFAQRLRESRHIGDYHYDEILALAHKSRGEDQHGYRSEFIRLVELARSLSMP